MNVSATAPTPSTTPAPTGNSNNAKSGQQIDYMKLIVAQMQNMNPMDPSSGGNGLATMMQAEELNQLNEINKALTSLQTMSQTGYASALIGKQVIGADSSGASVTGIVTGVKLDPSGPLLTVGSTSLRMLDILSIASVPSAGA